MPSRNLSAALRARRRSIRNVANPVTKVLGTYNDLFSPSGLHRSIFTPIDTKWYRYSFWHTHNLFTNKPRRNSIEFSAVLGLRCSEVYAYPHTRKFLTDTYLAPVTPLGPKASTTSALQLNSFHASLDPTIGESNPLQLGDTNSRDGFSGGKWGAY